MTTNAHETPPFADCSADNVFAEISARASTPELRTLWTRLQDEIGRDGVGASAAYLSGEFTRLKQEFTRELSNND